MSLSLQGIIATLNAFWEKQGCLIQLGVDAEVGAGTMHPETFLRVLGQEPWRGAYVQTSRQPTDGLWRELTADPAALAEAGIRQVERIGDCRSPATIAAA